MQPVGNRHVEGVIARVIANVLTARFSATDMTLVLDPLQDRNARSFDELRFSLASSQGQFKLLFGHCNYRELRQQVTAHLLTKVASPGKDSQILEFHVESQTTSLLPSLLEGALTQPYAVIISGLETASGVRQILDDLNQRRELLRDRCEFPILLWLDDRLLSLMLRHVSDLESWATIYEFDIEPHELIEQIDRFCNRVFDRVMTPNPDPFLARYPLVRDRDRHELNLGLRRLKRSGYHLTPQLRANIYFVVGRRAYEQGKLEAATHYFQHSLDYWTTISPDLTIASIHNLEHQSETLDPFDSPDPALVMVDAFEKPRSHQYIQAQSKQGVLWIHLGLCQMPGQHLPDSDRHAHLNEAAQSFRQGLAAFDAALRPELNAAAIVFLAQVLEDLDAWRPLQALLRQAITLHKPQRSILLLGVDYLLLAEVALREQHWQQVRMWATRAQQLLSSDLPDESAASELAQGSNFSHFSQNSSPPDASEQFDRAKRFDRAEQPKQPDHAATDRTQAEPHNRRNQSTQPTPTDPSDPPHQRQRSTSPPLHPPPSPPEYSNSTQPFLAVLVQLAHLYQALAAQTVVDTPSLAHSLAQAQAQLPRVVNDHGSVLDPVRYLKWLERSRQIYFKLGRYREAFQLKLKYQLIAQQYGFQAFVGIGQLEARPEPNSYLIDDSNGSSNDDRDDDIGQAAAPLERSQRSTHDPAAPTPIPNANPRYGSTLAVSQEIQASGRGRDIQNLVDLLVRPDHKLIAIHGQSGVGKSSLIRAGLVPTLRRTSISGRVVLPIVLGFYADWPARLIRELSFNLGMLGYAPITDCQDVGAKPWKVDVDRILTAVDELTTHHLAFVFMFDQFEEFFFANSDPSDRLNFYYFLDRLLSLPFVKAALAVRDDCLHCLLECDRWLSMEVTQGDILKQSSRYYIGNFSRGEARNLIRSLTANPSSLTLDADLIEELVRDLAAEFSEVRPIELQIVGVQLQHERITSLDQYRAAGPKANVVRRFLIETIRHCGLENETTAIALLFCLTDKNGTRPIRTDTDLAQATNTSPEPLATILHILCDCGLIFALSDASAYRYQLVHDYFVPFIRQEQELRHSAETEALRQENRQLYEDKELLEQLAEAQDRRRQSEQTARRLLALGVIVSTLGAIAFGVLATFAQQARQRAELAERQAAFAAIEAHSSAATALWLANDSLNAIVDGLRASTRLATFPESHQAFPRPDPTQPDPTLQALTYTAIETLNPILQNVVERNRLEGHSNSILGVEIAPDGTFLASVSWDESLRVWSPTGQVRYHIPKAHRDAVTTVAIAPDSATIATGGNDRTVKLWHAADGVLIADLKGHTNIVTSVVFSPDGRWLASADTDGMIMIWDCQRQQAVQRFQAHPDWILDLAFSPDGLTLASASRDRSLRLWSLEGELQREFLAHTGGITAVDFSPNGRELVTASADGSAILWSQTGAQLATFQDHDGWVRDARFSPDGETIATSDDQTISLWQRDGTRRDRLMGHHDRIWSLSFDPTGSTLASAGADHTIRLWDNTDHALARFPKQVVPSIATSSKGHTIATANGNRIYLYTTTGQPLAQLQGHTAQIVTVAFNPAGDAIVSAAEDGTARVWFWDDRRDHYREQTVLLHGGTVQAAVFSWDGITIATAGDDGVVRLWDARTGARQRTLYGHTNQTMGVAFDPLNERLATASSDNTVRLWTRTGEEILTLYGHKSSVNWVTFSPNGEYIASASADNTIRIWTRNGTSVATLVGHTGPVNGVVFSADSRTLASVGDDRTVRLWHVNGKALMAFEAHDDRALSVAFSTDNQTLFTTSTDNTLRVWTLNLNALIQHSCRWVQPYLAHNPSVTPENRQICDEFVRSVDRENRDSRPSRF